MKPPAPSSSGVSLLLKKARVSPILLTFLAFVAFVTILYSQDLRCLFGQFDYSDHPKHNKYQTISPTKKNGGKLPFAIGETEEGCDVFSGRWVRDEVNRPLYEESECPYIQPQLTCQEHGRPDKDYQHWRWQPHGCTLPRFCLLQPVLILRNIFFRFYSQVHRMENLLPIRNIRNHMTDWMAIITVQEKQHVLTAFSSPTKFQKYIFVDSEGSKVQGIIFNYDIPRMSQKLQVSKKYLISNAEVRKIDQDYQIDGIEQQWVISSRTVVQELPADDDLLPVSFSYTKFTDLARFINSKKDTVDVLAVAIHALPAKTVKKDSKDLLVQRIVIINQEFQPVQLSIWNDFVEHEGQQIVNNLRTFPTLICRRIRVNSFNGVALSTKHDSAIIIDPPIQEARELKNWATRNADTIATIINTGSYNKYNPQLAVQEERKVCLISNLNPNDKTSWVTAVFAFDHILQRYWYMACKNCHRSTSAPYKFAFECNYCGQTHPAEPRCRFDIDLTDRSGTITASIFGDLAEKLLSFSAIEAMEYSKKDEVLPLENVHAQLRSKRFIAQIRASPTAVSDGKQRYTIVYYYPEETTQGSSQFISHPDCSSSLTHAEQSPLSQALAAQIESPGPANKADKPRTSAVRLSLDEKFEICSNMAEEASTDTSHGSTKKLKRSN